MLRIGIEQEFVFGDAQGRYLDADVSDYETFSRIVEAVPCIATDARYLDCKSLEKQPKRCYVEGFERHDADGILVETLPKALEIRTLPHVEIDSVVAELSETYQRVMTEAKRYGMQPLLTSRHPFKMRIECLEDTHAVEAEKRTSEELALARRAMLTHGLHVSVSNPRWDECDLADRIAKILFYTPELTAWSFSSPFHKGQLFEGDCARNYHRASSRRLADMQLRKGQQVIEYRGFDAPGGPALLRALLVLYSGLLYDQELPGRARVQDPERIKNACLAGFTDARVRQRCQQVLDAAASALPGEDVSFELLQRMLDENDTYAQRLKNRYAECGSIMTSIEDQYEY